jgi:perosamine synthetase
MNERYKDRTTAYLNSARERIFVSQPKLDGREQEYVMKALASGWLTSYGRFVSAFEQAFADYCGVRHAVAVCNGTAALHLCLLAHALGPQDEVIVPTLTYIATANAVRYCGATPTFVDNDPLTFNMLPEAAAASITPRTKAIIPVHMYGQPVDMDAILDIAARHGLIVIEDAAEAVGARYKGRMVGGLVRCLCRL